MGLVAAEEARLGRGLVPADWDPTAGIGLVPVLATLFAVVAGVVSIPDAWDRIGWKGVGEETWTLWVAKRRWMGPPCPALGMGVRKLVRGLNKWIL